MCRTAKAWSSLVIPLRYIVNILRWLRGSTGDGLPQILALMGWVVTTVGFRAHYVYKQTPQKVAINL